MDNLSSNAFDCSPPRTRREQERRGASLGRVAFGALALLTAVLPATSEQADGGAGPVYEVTPIGWVRKVEGRTTIVIEPQYQPAMMGLAELPSIWVLYWFDRNDTPQGRSVLQVHPRNDPANPLRGVFATRAPFRPNLIGVSQCRVISVRDNVIEIDDIDAWAETPVLDIKPWAEGPSLRGGGN